jgi:nucleosome binding factor SPN SPT16 subunit
MLLNEFIYFNKESSNPSTDDRYNPLADTSVLTSKDTRKTRLTLKTINDLRKAGDAREVEQKEHLEFVKVMYATPVEPAA